MRNIGVGIDADVVELEKLRADAPLVRSGYSHTKRIDHVRTNQICASDGAGVCMVVVAGIRRVQDIVRGVGERMDQFQRIPHVAAEQRVLVTQLIVDARHKLSGVLIVSPAESDFAAGIVGLRKSGGDVECRLAKLRGIDSIADER